MSPPRSAFVVQRHLARRAAAAAAPSGGSPLWTAARAALVDLVGLGIGLLQVGQILPQHAEMYEDKSTAGLSPWLLFFNSMYTFLAFVDILIKDRLAGDGGSAFKCHDSAWRCIMGAQPLLQMFLSAVLSFGLWYWFLRYHKNDPSGDEEDISANPWARAFYDALPAETFCLLNVVLMVAISMIATNVAVFSKSETANHFADVCGQISAVFNGFMWVPQIIVTVAYGHRGALSVLWLYASVIMDVVYSVYLALCGYEMSVWLNNVPDAVCTGILIVIVGYYDARDKKQGTNEFGYRLSRLPPMSSVGVSNPYDDFESQPLLS